MAPPNRAPSRLLNLFVGTAAAATLMVVSQFANAGTVNCPGAGDPPPNDRIFTITTTTSPACEDYGAGNLSGSAGDPMIDAGWILLDRSDDATPPGSLQGSLDMQPAEGTTSGSFTLAPGLQGLINGGYELALGLKVGSGGIEPSWAVFTLDGALSGSWSVTGSQALSHGMLYAICTAPNGCAPPDVLVPLPAAAWLFGSAVLGLAGIARRRRSV